MTTSIRNMLTTSPAAAVPWCLPATAVRRSVHITSPKDVSLIIALVTPFMTYKDFSAATSKT